MIPDISLSHHGFEFGNASLGMRRIGDKCFIRPQPFHGLLVAQLGAPRQIYSIKQIGGCAARLFRAWPEMSRGEARSHHMYVMGHGKGSLHTHICPAGAVINTPLTREWRSWGPASPR